MATINEPDDVADLLAKTKLEQINEVSFAGKGLKLNTADDAVDIVKAITEAKDVQSLRLGGNTIGVAAAEAIAKALEKRPEFERARWSDIFTGRLRAEIPVALESLGAAIITANAHLVEIDLSDNAFGPDGVKACKQLLQSEACYSIRELRFNNNGLGIGGGKILSAALIECHKKSSADGRPLSLQVFITGRNRLENEGATALALAFKTIGTLEHVAMPQNGINHEGITALADSFANNKKLRIVNLNDNTFTEKGAKSMAAAFVNLPELEVINFGDCLVRSSGALAIAQSIQNGVPKLKELNLSFGEIKLEAAQAVAESVLNKEHLEKLDLNGNCLGGEGIESMKSKFESKGILDKLGSFDDDEGDDEDNDGEGEVVEDDDVKEDTEGDVSEDPILQVQGLAITPRTEEQDKVSCTVGEFLKRPTSDRLLGLGPTRSQLLVDELGRVENSDSIVKMYMKISSVIDMDEENIKNAVYQCSDAIMTKAFTSDVRDEEIVNSLLVYMGLLKSEDKIQPFIQLKGPIITLSHVVQQTYFTKQSVSTLSAFLSRPHRILETYPAATHQLLQALYTS